MATDLETSEKSKQVEAIPPPIARLMELFFKAFAPAIVAFALSGFGFASSFFHDRSRRPCRGGNPMKVSRIAVDHVQVVTDKPFDKVSCEPTAHRLLSKCVRPPPSYPSLCLREPTVAAWLGVG